MRSTRRPASRIEKRGKTEATSVGETVADKTPAFVHGEGGGPGRGFRPDRDW